MKHELMEIVIRRSILFNELMKNETLLILLNAFNAEKDGCFKAVFMVI
jgi:hypothetical protein